tara:strand:+ start:41 stop:745 length:705 start_codon:yes stop_codon:yes gene_type:complete
MKFLKALYLYLKSKSVQSNPNLDIIFKTIKQLDYKADVKNIKKFNSYSVSKKLYNDKQILLDLVRTNEFKKGTFGYDLKHFWSDQSVDLVKEYAERIHTKNKAKQKFTDLFWMNHDIIHFLNGYNTTPLGEVAVLSFTLAQEKRPSYLLFIMAGFFFALKHGLKNTIAYPKICFEAYKRGRKSKWFMIIDWEQHLNKTTNEVKQLLNLSEPPKFWNYFLEDYMRLHNYLKKKAA